MNRKSFSTWFNSLGRAWKEKNPNGIPPLFAEEFQYYETPFEKPYTTKEELIKLWSEVPTSQKDIQFDFDILAISDNIATAHWIARFTRIKQNKKTVLDGIFLVQLNNKGLCTIFRMWWVAKE